jgi:hypothetical protein
MKFEIIKWRLHINLATMLGSGTTGDPGMLRAWPILRNHKGDTPLMMLLFLPLFDHVINPKLYLTS